MKSIPLIAAQRFEIGTVTVSNDASSLFVRFRIDVVPGTLLHDLRVHVALGVESQGSERGIPHHRGNLIPGQFAHRAATAGVVDHTFTIPITPAWRAGGTLWLAAHATAGDSLRPVRVVSAQQGTRRNGRPVAPERSDPNKALDPDCPATWTPSQPITFFTVGFGGQITVDFGQLLDAATFPRITCWEVTGGNHMTEKVRLEVAPELSGPWVALPQEPTNGRPGSLALITATSVAVVGAPRYRYVRVIDSTGVAIDPALPEPCYEDGFDLDGVCVQLPDRETAWALPADDTPRWTGDAAAGSWGQAFAYTLE